jgi:putative endonuclease
MKVFTSKSQKIGELGEDIACMFLGKHGFTIGVRNYTKKWGEIDVVAEKQGILYFFEVKSRSVANLDLVSPETSKIYFAPEENMHFAKRKRLARVIETYLISHRIGNRPWEFGLIVVFIDIDHRNSRVKLFNNIIL